MENQKEIYLAGGMLLGNRHFMKQIPGSGSRSGRLYLSALCRSGITGRYVADGPEAVKVVYRIRPRWDTSVARPLF